VDPNPALTRTRDIDDHERARKELEVRVYWDVVSERPRLPARGQWIHEIKHGG